MNRKMGKMFEEDFKNSVAATNWIYRLRDGTSSWDEGNMTRFQAQNICDYIVMAQNYLYLLELKSTLGSSIPFSNFRENQIKQLSSINHRKIRGYFIINFREQERTFAVSSDLIKAYIETSKRKSIPIVWCKENGIQIPTTKKRTRYSYDLSNLLI